MTKITMSTLGRAVMSRDEALKIMVSVQNRPENHGQDILTFCGFMDTADEIIAHAKRYGWEG